MLTPLLRSGRNGTSELANAWRLRVCMSSVPGPVYSATSTSPEVSERNRLLVALRIWHGIPACQATTCPVSTV